MRLWHKDLLPYLPKQQLVAQWCELNSIYAKQDKHILINYVYEYDKTDLYYYSILVINEMKKRIYKIRNFDKYNKYFQEYKDKIALFYTENIFKNHQNEEYLKICCWNLYEKYLRGQEGFTDEAVTFIKSVISKRLCKKGTK